MKLPRRRFLSLAATSAVLPIAARVARGQGYPNRPVRIVVGFSAGGTTDIGARLIAERLAERLGQPFVVENRPGAATNIAVETVVRSPPDGYTLMMITSTNSANVSLYTNLKFSVIRDLAPVAGVMRSPYVLEVHPSVPVKSVPEFIAYAKANPGTINMASFGTGSGSHLSGELFKMRTGIQMTHVPYRGSAPMLIDLISGQVQLAFDNLSASVEHIRAGKLRALAVTAVKRSEALPDVPTVAEFLPGYESSAWIGLAAPRDTPAEIIDTLNRETNATLEEPAVKARIAELAAAALPGSPADFGKLVADETEKWGKVIRTANIKVE